MASGQVLAKFHGDYKKIEGEVARWRAFQERLLSLMRTISNVLTRLPMLEKVENYGNLKGLSQDFPKRLLGKQVVEIEKLIKQAHSALYEMSTTVATMEKIYKSSEKTVGQNKSLSAAIRCVEDGPIPSINDALDGLHAVWQMHSTETILQERLAAEVNYATDPQELSHILVAMQDMPNIDRQKIDDAFDVMRIAVELKGMFRWGVKLTGSSCLQTASVKRGSAIMASSRPKIETEIWSDLACPWCYVGCQRINKAVAKLGDKADVDITWHAFLLDRNYHSMHPDGESLEPYYQAKFGKDAESIKKRLTDSGAPDGALFSNWTWRSSTFPGHRLVALGRAHGKSHATKEHLFKKIYEQGENISSIESLIEAGKELGLPNVEEWMNSDKGTEEVLEDDTVAKTQLRVSGVPAFFIRSGQSKTYFLSGAQPVEVFLEAFDRVLAEAGNESV